MESQIRERIRTYLSMKGISVNKIATDTGYPQSTLQKQINHEVTLSVKTLYVILDYCKELSADWVVLGEGEMIKQPAGKTINIAKMGGNGAGQVNIVGDNNQLSKDEALRILLQQQQQLIDAVLEEKK